MSDVINVNELLKRYQAWAEIAAPKYAQQQWLLSKWENNEGVEWSSEKFKALLQTIVEAVEPKTIDYVLDLGCGGGWITDALSKHSKKIIGLDFSLGMLKQAQKNFPHIPFFGGEISQLPFKGGTFNCLVCYFVFINFMEDVFVQRCFSEIFRVLQPGGRALIGQLPDQNGSADYDTAKKEYLEYCRKTFKLGESNRDVQYMPQKLYNRQQLKEFFEKAQMPYHFQDSFNPFYRAGQPQRVAWRFDVILTKP